MAYTIGDVHAALLESQEDVEFLLSIVESFIPPPAAPSEGTTTPEAAGLRCDPD